MAILAKSQKTNILDFGPLSAKVSKQKKEIAVTVGFLRILQGPDGCPETHRRECFIEGTCVANLLTAYYLQGMWISWSHAAWFLFAACFSFIFDIFADSDCSGPIGRLAPGLGIKITICFVCAICLTPGPAAHATGN